MEFENLSHVFGNCGSLTNAVTTVKLQALREEMVHPLAAEVVLRGSMVDDNLASVMTVGEAVEVMQGLRSIYANVGMSIHKWSSSHPEVLHGVSPCDLANTVELQDFGGDESLAVNKALGIVWSTEQDTFTYFYEPVVLKAPTQRELLKQYMAIFDPLGWICPYIIVARMLYRDTCLLKLGWDTPIPAALEARWERWFSQLPNLRKLSLPRWVGCERDMPGVLHVFSDASHEAYGACAYWAAGTVDLSTSRNLIASKAKINSSSARTIPQLELMGAMIGLDLAKSLCRALDYELEKTFFWVDAENTLQRVLRPACGLERFVARRVAVLREETNLTNWRWVGSDQNPADVLSRGTKVEKLVQDDLWWHGPDFLECNSTWPTLKVVLEPHVELEGEQELLRLVGIFHATAPQEEVWWQKFSSFSKCEGIMLRVLEFISRTAKRTPFPQTRIGAKLALFRWEQQVNWAYELDHLQSGNPLPLRHPWNAFDCQIDQGIVQVSTRTSSTPLILLPNRSYLTRTWIRHVHENELRHAGGHRSLLAQVREVAWVLHGVSECKNIVWNCVSCKGREPRVREQKMAPLPKFRTCLLYTSPSPRDLSTSRMPSSA